MRSSLFPVGGLLLFGTTTSLFAKIVYEIKSVGADGQQKFFHKPWCMTTVMFLGMTMCLPLAFYQEWSRKRSKREQGEAELAEALLANAGQSPNHPSELKQTLMLAIPTFFDLLATILMNVGLLWVTASVYQMMRGAEMLFAAFFSITFLGRKLNRFHLMGLACCVVGISLVGSSSILSGEGSVTQVVSQEQMLMGMLLIIISQAVQAAQLTFEDFFMTDLDMAPMKIVGFEGLFGVIGTLGIMAPICSRLKGVEGEGIHEDLGDTLTMIRNSRALQVILAVDMVALLMYNVSGMMVTGHLGAVFRTVLETMRTLFVWLVDLFLFYGGFGLGESWSSWSLLQAAGFAVLVAGTLVYRRGDQEGFKQEMAEALAVQAAQEPIAAYGHDGSYSPVPSGGAPAAPHVHGSQPASSLPVAMRPRHEASEAMSMAVGSLSRSFRANQTISGSYVGSFPHRGSYKAPGSYLGGQGS